MTNRTPCWHKISKWWIELHFEKNKIQNDKYKFLITYNLTMINRNIAMTNRISREWNEIQNDKYNFIMISRTSEWQTEFYDDKSWNWFSYFLNITTLEWSSPIFTTDSNSDCMRSSSSKRENCKSLRNSCGLLLLQIHMYFFWTDPFLKASSISFCLLLLFWSTWKRTIRSVAYLSCLLQIFFSGFYSKIKEQVNMEQSSPDFICEPILYFTRKMELQIFTHNIIYICYY